jgi:hypothetical protein
MTLAENADEAAASFWDIHRGHVVLLLVWVLVVGAVLVRGKLQARAAADRPATLPRGGWLWATAAASVLGASGHLAVIDEHFHEAVLYGVFFLVLTIVQFGWAAWLLRRPTLPVLFAGAAASVLVALLWLATRTVGIPLGPEAGEKEGFGALDIACSAAEVAVAVCAVLVVRTLGSRSARRPAFAH